MGNRKLLTGAAVIAIAASASTIGSAAAAQANAPQSDDPPQPMTQGDRLTVAFQQEYLEAIKIGVRNAKAARLAKDCQTWNAYLEEVDDLLDNVSNYAPEEIADELFKAYNTEKSEPCGDGNSLDAIIGMELAAQSAFSLGVEYGQQNVPSTGTGFRRDGAPGQAPETFAIQSPDDVDYIGFSAGLYLDRFSIEAHYGEGDASASTSIAGGGGVDSGIVYGELSPGGSSGIAAQLALDGLIEVDVTRINFDIAFDLIEANKSEGPKNWPRRYDSFTADSLRNQFYLQRAAVTAGYQRIERDYLGRSSVSGEQNGFTFEFSQTRQQEIREDQFHLGALIDLVIAFSDRFALRSEASASAYYRDTSLFSEELNQNNFTGPPDDVFTVVIERDDDGFGLAADMSLFVDINLDPGPAPGPVLSLGGGIGYQSSTGAIFNPNSGDQVFFDGLTTDLTSEDTFRWFFGASVAAPF